MKVPLLPRGRAAAFTLTEVLVVITIIGVLFALVLGGFSYAQNASKRNTSRLSLTAMSSALGRYQQEVGEFPEPGRPGDTVEVAGKTYEVAGGAMLYQALSGDGNDQIKIASEETERMSNGSLDDEETKLVYLNSMPKNMWTKQGDTYFMADGWGRPFQYVKAVDIDPTLPNAPPPITINNTFDLWSYGPDVDNTTARSIDTITDSELKADSRQWISNW